MIFNYKSNIYNKINPIKIFLNLAQKMNYVPFNEV